MIDWTQVEGKKVSRLFWALFWALFWLLLLSSRAGVLGSTGLGALVGVGAATGF